METFLYNFVMLVSRIHTTLLSMNDQRESSFSDKELHFIVIGAFGIALILVLHPIFLWLAKTGHTMIVSFLYVITVIFVLTFSIEIGQGFYGTGIMEFDDVVYGISGFLVFFCIFLVIRGIIHLILRLGRGKKEDEINNNDPEYF